MGKLTRAVLAAVLASLTVGSVAHALRRVPAFIGRAEISDNLECTNVASHLLRNDCGGPIFIEVPLSYENAGSKNITFTINSPSLQSSCTATAFSPGDGFVASATKSVTSTNTFQTLTTELVNVSSGMQFMGDCFLENGARMTALSYAQ
jgi:hypothetical protein